MDHSQESFRAAMRRLLSGISLVTTQWQGRPYGLIATSVSSFSMDPPSIIVCINKEASCHDAIANGGLLCVNLLSAAQEHLVARFSSPAMRDQRFAGGDWHQGLTGAPVFDEALACVECEVTDSFAKYSHTIFVADVKNVSLSPQDHPVPLPYFEGKCGFDLSASISSKEKSLC